MIDCSLCTIPLYALILFVVFQIYRFVIRTNSKLQHYRNQGIPTIFAPFKGFLKQVGIDVVQHNDMFYSWKQLNSLTPKPRAFASNLGDKPLIAIKDPELIKQFFNLQEKHYVKAPAAIDVAKKILRNGSLLSEGAIWKAHRKLTAPIYSFDAVKERVPETVQIIDAAWDRLKAKNVKKIDFLREVQHVLLEVTGKLFFDIELHKLEFKGQPVSVFLAELIDRAALEAFNPFTILFSVNIVGLGIHPRHKALVKDINDIRGFLYGAAKAKLGEILAEKEKGTYNRKLPLLLELLYQQKLKLTQESLDEVDLVDEYAMFVLGAFDTTSHAIIYGSYFHLNNPTSQKKLVEEANQTFRDLSQVTTEALNQMEYTNAFLKETLRMGAPLPNYLPRQAIDDHQLGDISIKAGTVLVVAGVTNSFDTDYHDEPYKFQPERWLDKNSKTNQSISKSAYVYIPFFSGPRTCPGKEIGTNNFKIVLGLFLKKFNYELTDKNYKLAYSAKLFNEPLHPLVYNIEAKN